MNIDMKRENADARYYHRIEGKDYTGPPSCALCGLQIGEPYPVEVSGRDYHAACVEEAFPGLLKSQGREWMIGPSLRSREYTRELDRQVKEMWERMEDRHRERQPAGEGRG